MKRLVLMLAAGLALAVPAFAPGPGRQHQRHRQGRAGRRACPAHRSRPRASTPRCHRDRCGGQYRFLELAPGPYKVSRRTGQLCAVERDVIVAVGRTSISPFALKLAGTRRERSTSRPTAPIVDPTVTGTTTNFTNDELENIPTSRDPFALMRTVPGVLLDQVNVGGNETGQQPLVLGKGARQQDTSWTIDGVEITDMGAPGPVADLLQLRQLRRNSGLDRRQRHPIAHRRRRHQPRHEARHEPVSRRRSRLLQQRQHGELERPGRTEGHRRSGDAETADHTIQTSDYGFDIGGPLLKDQAWFFASLAQQDIRDLQARDHARIDQTVLRNPQVKVNWQATLEGHDQLPVLQRLQDQGRPRQQHRPTAVSSRSSKRRTIRTTPTATRRCTACGRSATIASSTRTCSCPRSTPTTTPASQLTPEGGMDAQAGRNADTSHGVRVDGANACRLRPQHFVSGRHQRVRRAVRGRHHDLKYGLGFRHVLNEVEVEWPGNGIVGIAQIGHDRKHGLRAQVFRQSNGANTRQLSRLLRRRHACV